MKTSRLLAALSAATLVGGAASAGSFSVDADIEDFGDTGSTTVPVFSTTFSAGAIASIDSIVIELAHSWAGDVDIVLTNPTATGGVFIDNFGMGSTAGTQSIDLGDGGELLAGVSTYTFVESGSPVPSGTIGNPLPGGTYSPEGDSGSVWENAHSAGTWTLEIYDDASGDDGAVGNITVNWTDVPEPGSLALMGLGGLALLRRRR